ncbi:DNA repair protein [Clostridium sp. chh4-2]|uniref:DNA repair protein n=1 Tax=Clostridium sp. chh4-2 TaxID=2067550 RepID=UPI000CCF4081|nr:DNA repair protein [Clostridium sp. chh4-2]PNV59202.1 DNA repair protein [Clostridium sp. chh4-2]
MGIFGGFFGKITSAIKSGCEKVASGVKKAANYVKEKVTGAWNKFTGKKTFEEAEALYQQISERYQKKRSQFDSEVDRYTDSIEQRVQNINKYKEKIKTELFVQMAAQMEKIKDISVSRDFTVEEYKAAVLSFDGVRSRSQLYKIDFNKHKFKTTLQAIFTAGFYTRKKAKETLYAVEEEEMKVNAEIAKMDAELTKLKVIDESLENVEEYFNSLIEIYSNLLVRLDNSVNYLYIRCISFAHKLVHKEMSIRRLPEMQQKEVEAIITASKIMKAMIDAQIMSLEDSASVKKYSDTMRMQYESVDETYRVA